MEIRPGKWGDAYGPDYVWRENLAISRDDVISRPYGKNVYFLELNYKDHGHPNISLTDEDMEELFLVWQIMKREYETGEEVKFDDVHTGQ